MAFGAGDWASATDPFIQAERGNITWGTWTIGGTGPPYSITSSTVGAGPVNGSVRGDDDLIEAYWQKESDPDTLLPAPGIYCDSWSISPNVHRFERPLNLRIEDRAAGTLDTYAHVNRIPAAAGSTLRVEMSYPNGSHSWCNAFIYFALSWAQKDPAQVIFSQIAHQCGGPLTLKTYLDQTSFEDASDRYDEWPVELWAYRKVGKTFAESVKEIIDHTADMISIRPADSTGEYKMHMHVRRSLTQRTTAINLDGKSVESYTVRPGDEYMLDAIEIAYGSGDGLDTSISSTYDVDEAEFRRKIYPGEGGGDDFPNSNVMKLRQAVRDPDDTREADIVLPFVNSIADAAQIDLNYWKDAQEEIEIVFSDLSHHNYSVGDRVTVSGGPFDASLDCVVFEKTHKVAGLNAVLRCLRLRNLAGTNPLAIDVGEQLFAFRANDHGKYWGSYIGGTSAYPQGSENAFANTYQMPFDRWMSHSRAVSGYTGDRSMSLWQMDRGTSGPGAGNPEPPRFASFRANDWPIPEFVAGQDSLNANRGTSQIFGDLDTQSTSDYTFYFVVWGGSISAGQYLFDTRSAGTLTIAFTDASGNVAFDDGGGFTGTQAAITGFQILTFVLDGSGANLAKIRRNGADLETGLDFTRVRIQNNTNTAFGGQYDGNGTNNLNSNLIEAYGYTSVHSSAEIDAVEAHLAEKFAISI